MVKTMRRVDGLLSAASLAVAELTACVEDTVGDKKLRDDSRALVKGMLKLRQHFDTIKEQDEVDNMAAMGKYTYYPQPVTYLVVDGDDRVTYDNRMNGVNQSSSDYRNLIAVRNAINDNNNFDTIIHNGILYLHLDDGRTLKSRWLQEQREWTPYTDDDETICLRRD